MTGLIKHTDETLHSNCQCNQPLVDFARKLLKLKGDGDVARVMRVFLDVDLRGKHELDIETFFEYFGIEFSEYNKRAFRLLAFGDNQVNMPPQLTQEITGIPPALVVFSRSIALEQGGRKRPSRTISKCLKFHATYSQRRLFGSATCSSFVYRY